MGRLVKCAGCGADIWSEVPVCRCGHRQRGVPRAAPAKRKGASWRSWAVAIVLGTFALTTFGVVLNHRPKGKVQVEAEAPKELPVARDQFLVELRDRIREGELLDHGTLELPEYGLDGIRLRFVFASPSPRMTPADAEVITKGLVTNAIAVLLEHGHDPKAEETFISAYCFQPAGKSVTGREQLLTFGSAHYDWNDEKVVFERHED